jgi:type 1 glutamine amidotransferase
MKRLAIVATALAALIASPSQAKALVDCPMRDTPFSTASPLMDVILSPAATAAVETVVPGMIKKMPPGFASKTPPTFAAILTVREAAGMGARYASDPSKVAIPDIAAIDAALAKVPVTDADRVARCARYDTELPGIGVLRGRPRVLLFEKINGFKDVPSVNAAHAAFVAMAQRKGWALAITDQGSAFSPMILGRFDAVIWNNISGDVLTLSQRAAFQSWMEHGGGFIGVHGTAGDPVYFWDWYVDTLLGARFAGHPMSPQFQTAKVSIGDATHPAAKGLPTSWDMNDEWYSFKNNPRATGSRIIATLDETTYKPDGMAGQNLRMGADHPIVWSRCIGRGRMFYSAIGHRLERYSDANYVKMLEQAVDWAADRAGSDCKAAK